MSTRTGFSRVAIALAAAEACGNPQPPRAPSRLIGFVVPAGTSYSAGLVTERGGSPIAGGQGGIVRALIPVAAGELVAYVGHVPPRAIGWELADFSLMTRLTPVSTGAADASRRP